MLWGLRSEEDDEDRGDRFPRPAADDLELALLFEREVLRVSGGLRERRLISPRGVDGLGLLDRELFVP